jgi:stalled ribosome alternative rescue factor ArfA
VDTFNNLVSFDFSCAVFDFSIPFRQKGEKNFGKNSFRRKGKTGIIDTFVDLPPVYMPMPKAKTKLRTTFNIGQDQCVSYNCAV